MASNQQIGALGEREICRLVPCPNCGKRLIRLPRGFPIFDIQCSRCLFRAQVKTVTGKPRGTIFGAGWDIYEKVLKAGHLSPPLFVNFRWFTKDGFHREIRFYPFVAKGNIKNYTLSPSARRANYRMFRYVKLDKIPSLQLHTLFDPNKKKI